MSRLDAIKQRLMSATPWPWHVSRDSPDERPRTVDVCDLVNNAWVVSPGPLKPWAADGDLIAHAPADLDFLLTEVLLLKQALVGITALGSQPTSSPWVDAARSAINDHEARISKLKLGEHY